ncbi:MAG: bifunctional adenosylcobinamide kinase/adenosylcobinamide-phosphate guanylyltransferase [Lachnospiraceae bacterium]|nr:bifunctional adenosylcobinamide kinase/adenosylcobinamide-phosphate guanylyltransferase [Lachnospiraceae bacterium]
MDLIIGGAYQGKLEYAKSRCSLSDEEIFVCTEDKGIEFARQCVYNIQEYTLYCVKNGIDALEIFKAHRDDWKDSVLICEDIFCGVVPLGKDMRDWREMTGRLCAYLSGEAESVTRIFCGLEQKLK